MSEELPIYIICISLVTVVVLFFIDEAEWFARYKFGLVQPILRLGSYGLAILLGLMILVVAGFAIFYVAKVVGIQVMGWLQEAVWEPQSLLAHLGKWDIEISWKGLSKIADFFHVGFGVLLSAWIVSAILYSWMTSCIEASDEIEQGILRYRDSLRSD